MKLKNDMANYIEYCLSFCDKIQMILRNRKVLRFMRGDSSNGLMTREELTNSRSVCRCGWNMLKWLTEINFEKNSIDFGIDNYYVKKSELNEEYEILGLMFEYYEMCLDGKLKQEERNVLEEIDDIDAFRNTFLDIKADLGDRSIEKILEPPLKRVNYLNQYIEVGRNCLVSDGLRVNNFEKMPEYIEFMKNKNLDTLSALIDTGKLDALFDGCIAVENFDCYMEIAKADVKLRGMDAHYSCWKMYCNRDKYKKIMNIAEPGSFFVIYSSFDRIDGELICEHNRMDIDLSGERVNNYVGIYRGSVTDRKFEYKLIVDTNPS